MGVLTRGLSRLPLPGFDFAGLVVWLLLAPQSWEPASRSTLFSRSVTFWRLCGASWSPPPSPCSLAHCGAPCLVAFRPGHCRITAGLASMDGPLLVSSDESQLCECLFVVLPRQLVGSGVCSPASPICPTSSIIKRSSFGLSASVLRQVFAMRSPFRVESVSVLDRNVDSSSTFLVFGWSLRDEVTLSGRVCLRAQSERRLFAHLT